MFAKRRIFLGKFAKTFKRKILRHFVPQDDKTVNVLRQPLGISGFVALCSHHPAGFSRDAGSPPLQGEVASGLPPPAADAASGGGVAQRRKGFCKPDDGGVACSAGRNKPLSQPAADSSPFRGAMQGSLSGEPRRAPLFLSACFSFPAFRVMMGRHMIKKGMGALAFSQSF